MIYDYLVVGSGFGGSVSAMRLAEKGYSVLVLEQGKRFRSKDFPKTNLNLFKYLWIPAMRMFGFQKLSFFKEASILSGVGVGGGSLVYASTLFYPEEDFFNSGQSCIAPDYLLVHEEIKDALIKQITRSYGEKPAESLDFTHLVDEANVYHLRELIKGQKIIMGGDSDPAQEYFAPTLVDEVKSGDKLMQEEVFGPILPILSYKTEDQPVHFINSRPIPLVLYLFTRKKRRQMKILRETCSGSATINDTVLQYMNTSLPFGGKGDSGMGKYHGKANLKHLPTLGL